MKALIILVLLISSASYAVNPREVPEFTQQGSLITLRVVPKDRTAKIFIVGHKAAAIELQKDAQVTRVLLVDNEKKETLSLNDQGDYYEVSGLPDHGQPYQLMVQTRVKGKIEEVKIDIPSRHR